jgi:hypothetical protein
MSVLNLALSNCALARQGMGDEFEKNMKKCNNMGSVQKMAAKIDSGALVGAIGSGVSESGGAAREVLISPMEVGVNADNGDNGEPTTP